MSFVKPAGTTETFSTAQREVISMDRAEERAGPEDVGNQALMRGCYRISVCSSGLSLSEWASIM